MMSAQEQSRQRIQAELDAGRSVDYKRRLGQFATPFCYFILLSHDWLADGAVSGWLIPSEFMDVNYGAAIKDYLLNRVRLLRIHRYDPNSVKFDDALVSSVVMWYTKEKTAKDYEVEFSYGGTLGNPDIVKSIRRSALENERKWTRFPEFDTRATDVGQARIKDTFVIKRGIATGDNGFFILDKRRIERHGLRNDYLVPILPSPRHLNVSEVLADEEGNPLLDDQLFLISCDLPEHQIKALYPELYSYLQTGVESVSERYLCKSKRTWYSQEQRKPAPILCTYMGRRTRDSEVPFRFILNHSKAIATNSYLMLYPKEGKGFDDKAQLKRMRTVWQELNGLTPEALVSEGRVYGGGLGTVQQ